MSSPVGVIVPRALINSHGRNARGNEGDAAWQKARKFGYKYYSGQLTISTKEYKDMSETNEEKVVAKKTEDSSIKGMKSRLDAALKELEITDVQSKKEAGIRTASEYATQGGLSTTIETAVRSAVHNMTWKEAALFHGKTALCAFIGTAGALVLANFIGKESKEAPAEGEVGSDSNPFATTEPVKASVRPLKSSSI